MQKKFYLSKIRSTFFLTCDIIPGRLIFCCMYHQTSHFNVKRWIVQGRLSNFQKKISCKNNPLKVKIQRTRNQSSGIALKLVSCICLHAIFSYLKMQQRISNKTLFVRTLFSTNYALLIYNSNLKLYSKTTACIEIDEFFSYLCIIESFAFKVKSK